MADATVVTQSPRPALSDLALTSIEAPAGQDGTGGDATPLDLFTNDQPPSVDELADPALAVPVNPDFVDPVEEEDPYGLSQGWEEAGGMNLFALAPEAEHSEAHAGIVAPTCPVDSYAAQATDGSWSCVAQYGPLTPGNSWFKWAVLIALGLLLIKK